MSNHGVALCIEDARILGLLFAHLQNKSQISALLNAYEEIRQPRISKAHTYETQARSRTSVAQGASLEARDAMMREVLSHSTPESMDEETFRIVWGTELELSTYDASESVEGWWNQWGGLFDCKERSRRPTSVQVLVSRGESD